MTCADWRRGHGLVIVGSLWLAVSRWEGRALAIVAVNL
jgi:hypothetical protein